MRSGMRVLACPKVSAMGTSAVLFEAEGEIALETQQRIWQLSRQVVEWSGVSEVQPGINNLLVVVDPAHKEAAEISARILDAWKLARPARMQGKMIEVGVVYGGERGIDMMELANHHGISAAEVAALHSGVDYTVFAPGSRPGYGYLFGLDPRLFTPRRATPAMRRVGANVSIGGAQTGMGVPAPADAKELSPIGWYVIGFAPEAPMPYDFSCDPPFLLSIGDRIRFRIDRVEP